MANHGTETGGRSRSVRHWEVYQNTFTWTDPNTPRNVALTGWHWDDLRQQINGSDELVFRFVSLPKPIRRSTSLRLGRMRDSGGHLNGEVWLDGHRHGEQSLS